MGLRLLKFFPEHFHAIEPLDFDQIVSELLFWENDLTFPASEVNNWNNHLQIRGI